MTADAMTEQDVRLDHEARIYASREARKLAALDPRDVQQDAIYTTLVIFHKNLAAANERIARLEGERDALYQGKIEMFSIQRPKPGQPPRWCALARGSKIAAYADTPADAISAALSPDSAPTPNTAGPQE